MYDDTSRDLVRLAGIGDARTIVDLACGTGATTRAILAAARPDASIVGIDGAKAMLDVAKKTVRDERVRYVLADAKDLAAHVDSAGAIVCNSAIWQLDLRAVFAAAAEVLAPGGRFAFNIGRQFIMLPFTDDELSRSRPSLSEYVQAIATLDHDYVAPLRRRHGRLLSPDIVEEMLTNAGLLVETFEVIGYEETVERQYAWLRIPIFADNVLYGMPYEQQV